MQMQSFAVFTSPVVHRRKLTDDLGLGAMFDLCCKSQRGGGVFFKFFS